jgi:ribosomal protein S18 acetylase RimI-like enzyme
MPEKDALIFTPYSNDLAGQIRAIYEASILNNTVGFVQDLEFHGPITDQATSFVRDGGYFATAQKDSKVIGFGALKKTEPYVFELCKLHIGSDHLGQGYGYALSQHLLNHAKHMMSAKKVILHVTTSQAPAIGLYKKLGFETTLQKIYTVNVNGIDTDFDTLHMEKSFT